MTRIVAAVFSQIRRRSERLPSPEKSEGDGTGRRQRLVATELAPRANGELGAVVGELVAKLAPDRAALNLRKGGLEQVAQKRCARMRAAGHDIARGIDVELIRPFLKGTMADARLEAAPTGIFARLRELQPPSKLRGDAKRGEGREPTCARFGRGGDGARENLQRGIVAVAEFRQASKELDEARPFGGRPQALKIRGRAVSIAADGEVSEDAKTDGGRQLHPIDALGVGRNLDTAGRPWAAANDVEDAGQIIVEQRLAVVEEREAIDGSHIDVAKAALEVAQGDTLDFGFERGIGTTDASKLTTMDDVEVEVPEVAERLERDGQPGLQRIFAQGADGHREVGKALTDKGAGGVEHGGSGPGGP